jgi:hypothetical protein
MKKTPYNQAGRNVGQTAPVKPNNGCKQGTTSDGRPWISGWNVSKDRGMVTVLIGVYKGSHEVTSQNGKTHLVMMAQIEYKNSGIVDHYPVTYCKETGYVQLKKHGWILNPKKGNMTRFTGGK